MTERAGGSRRSAVVAWAIRLAAEAGWITVVYAAAAVLLDGRSPVLGPLVLAALAGLGAMVAAFSRSRPNIGAALLLAVAVGAGALGWLASDEVRGLVLTDPAAALFLHHAGWLGALAAVRGAVARAGVTGSGQLEELLRYTLPFVALVWAVAMVLTPGPLRLPFSITAIWGTVLLISASLVGLGLARLAVLHAGVGDRGVRRRWRWLVVAAGFAVAPLAAPFVVLSGIPVAELLNPLVGPLQTVLLLIAYVLGGLADWLIELLRPVLAPLGPLLDELAARMEARPRPADGEYVRFDTTLFVVLAAVAALVAVAIVYLMARQLLLNRHRAEFDEASITAGEEHAIVVPPGRQRRSAAAGKRGGRRMPVRGVVTAYLNALRELDRHPPFARQPTETPARHALRTRQEGMPASAELARLAAGYQLARYGDRALTRREDARAITRFERLRRTLRALLRPRREDARREDG